jgi:hypothetical protein
MLEKPNIDVGFSLLQPEDLTGVQLARNRVVVKHRQYKC